MVAPNHRLALAAFISTLILQFYFPEMNYFVRADWVIFIAFLLVNVSTLKGGWTPWKDLIWYDSPEIKQIALGMLISLISLYVIFH